ncbi:catalase family protein [Olivibacter ginsenosidimutans]|uniref:Catalase family protein n=1 Tax=Olivibacter ginsenosidimutans TaxID=1176537 RepID=A0ABP9B7G5_9SPHI
MATISYVKYRPEVENIKPGFDQKEKVITEDIKKYIHQSSEKSKTSYATRDAHAKGYAALKAQFEVLGNLPAELAQGLYAWPGKYEAVVRFSNGSARVTSDKNSGKAMGIAIKVLGVGGSCTLEDEAECGNFDYNMINWPVFFCNSADHYRYIDKLFLKVNDYFAKGTLGRLKFMYHWLTGIGTFFPNKQSWKEFRAFSSFQKIKPENTLLHTFYSMGAVRHGDYIAKLRAAPVHAYAQKVNRRTLDVDAADQVFGPALIAEIKEHDYAFDIQVQLCTDLKQMPVNDLTKEWAEELSPYRNVARLYIPRQDVSGTENFEVMEHLSFTPFRCFKENEPIGELQRTRKEAYRTSSTLRHQLNSTKRKEPQNLNEIFGNGTTA